MLFTLVLACTSESVIEQQCYLDYLDVANANEVAFLTCADVDGAEQDDQTCSADLDAGAASNLATLGTCAGDGCVADWQACMELSGDMSCYEALDECGGWVYAGLVDDCNNDIAFCGSSVGCVNDYYACMRFAAGG